jgi:hypothetical protein
MSTRVTVCAVRSLSLAYMHIHINTHTHRRTRTAMSTTQTSFTQTATVLCCSLPCARVCTVRCASTPSLVATTYTGSYSSRYGVCVCMGHHRSDVYLYIFLSLSYAHTRTHVESDAVRRGRCHGLVRGRRFHVCSAQGFAGERGHAQGENPRAAAR